MNKQEFINNLHKISFLSEHSKQRIIYLEKIGDFTSIRLQLDKVIDEIDLTSSRLENKQLVVNVLNEQKEVCNSMMDYIINMIEISYDMKKVDEERRNIGKPVKSG